MDTLTGAVVAAVAAWLSIVAAIVLPVPDRVFRRLRWAGAATVAVVGLSLAGLPLPAEAPAAILGIGLAVAVVPWPGQAPDQAA